MADQNTEFRIEIMPSRIKLYVSAVTCSLVGTASLVAWCYTLVRGPAEMIAFMSLLGIFGLIALVCGIAAFSVVLSGTPVLRITGAGVMIADYFGRKRSRAWKDILSISVNREVEGALRHGTPIWANYIYFRGVNETNLNQKPRLNIAEHRLPGGIEKLIQDLATLPIAMHKLDNSAKIYRASPKNVKLNVFKVVGVILLGSLMIYGLSPKFSASEYNRQKPNLIQSRVQISCSRAANINCDLTITPLDGSKAPHSLQLKEVTGVVFEVAELTTVYLVTNSSRQQIATVNQKKVHTGWDGEKMEPYLSINRLKHFIERSNDPSLLVNFTDPSL